MFTLYLLFGCMLAIALILLSIPFIKNTSAYLTFGFIALVICISSGGIYLTQSNISALSEWIHEGQAHYTLLLKIKQLGGVGEIIHQIKLHLQQDPSDAKGWFILGKIYLSEQNYPAAKQALQQAMQLQPTNMEIKKILMTLDEAP